MFIFLEQTITVSIRRRLLSAQVNGYIFLEQASIRLTVGAWEKRIVEEALLWFHIYTPSQASFLRVEGGEGESDPWGFT